jgi:hypothetical protein
MNILFVIHRYNELKTMNKEELAKQVPRVGISLSSKPKSYFRWEVCSRIFHCQVDYQGIHHVHFKHTADQQRS